MAGENEFEYDVALSFAGEDRAIAKEFAHELAMNGLKVFYDEQEAADLWGQDLTAHLADLYENKARYCVIFISQYYFRKRWTNFEREHIQARASRGTTEYLLPLRLDDTEVPDVLEAVGYRDTRQHSLGEIAYELSTKVAKALGVDPGLTPHEHWRTTLAKAEELKRRSAQDSQMMEVNHGHLTESSEAVDDRKPDARVVGERVSNILYPVLSGDLDLISYEEIKSGILRLEGLASDFSDERDLDPLLELVFHLISHLYVARGYASPELPRHADYYQNMTAARQLARQVRNMWERDPSV